MLSLVDPCSDRLVHALKLNSSWLKSIIAISDVEPNPSTFGWISMLAVWVGDANILDLSTIFAPYK